MFSGHYLIYLSTMNYLLKTLAFSLAIIGAFILINGTQYDLANFDNAGVTRSLFRTYQFFIGAGLIIISPLPVKRYSFSIIMSGLLAIILVWVYISR